MSIILTRQNEGKSFHEKFHATRQPRPLIHIVPADVTAFSALVETPVQGTATYTGTAKDFIVPFNDSPYASLYGTILTPTTSATIAKSYSTQTRVELLVIPKGETHKLTLETNLATLRTQSHLLIVVEAGASLSLIHTLEKNIIQGLHDIQIEILLQEHASADITTLQNCDAQVYLRYATAAHVETSATLTIHDVLIGASYMESESNLHLLGTHAVGKQSATLFGNDQRFMISQQSHHLVGESESNIATKAVLQKGAQAGFKGLVAIAPGAAESEGYQQMDVLLLDNESRASAIPELAIQTDIVTCSHGATIGELDAEQLFYLQSRGMDRATAIRVLLVGFVTQGITHLSETQQEMVLAIIEKRLNS